VVPSFGQQLERLGSGLGEQLKEQREAADRRQAELAITLGQVARDIQLLGTKCDSLNTQLDDVQEKMYDFEQNKRNNLIFYGVPGEERENRDDLRIKILTLLRLHMNIRREVPISKATRMHTGRRERQGNTTSQGRRCRAAAPWSSPSSRSRTARTC
jgi:hypothetical protein